MSKGFTVILVVVDRFTKYAHFGTLPTSFNAHKVAEVFLEIVIKHHGLPKTIVSDRDPIFLSKFWKQLFHLSGTHLNYSTAYHPQTDGQTEVVNQGLEQYLWVMVSTRRQHWDRLPWAEYCYNTSYHSSIKMSHFQALYGRMPLSVIPYPPGASKVAVVEDLLVERDELLRYYGPYEVVEHIGKMAYRLALPATSKIHPVFHVSIIKAFLDKGDESVMELPEEVQDGRPREQPVAVCDSREVLQNGKPIRQVLVKWDNRSLEEATWECLSDFQNAYPDYNLGDKVVFEENGNVTPVQRSVRASKR
ncbi:ty3-gypsy retrotransposon protein [Tanacetum coccineum]